MKKKIVIDGEEQTLNKVGIDNAAYGWFNVPIRLWNATIYLFVGSVDDLIESGRKLFKDRPDAISEIEGFAGPHRNAFASVRFVGENDFIIRLNSFRPCLIDDMLTLSHESLHVAQRILSNVGAEVDPAGSETLAYTHQYILGRLISEMLKGVRSATSVLH